MSDLDFQFDYDLTLASCSVPPCIRAHHGMCLHFFQGKGYSLGFTSHMTYMKRYLETANPVIRISCDTDDICSQCPNNHSGVCTSSEKVGRYDQGVLKCLGLENGSELPYSEFTRMVAEQIILVGKRREICGDCQWNELCGG